jgi:predicted porin
MMSLVLGALMTLWSPMVAALDLGEVVIHGFVSETYTYTTDNNIMSLESEEGVWDWFEAGINFTIEPVDRLRIGVQLYSRDLGEQGNGDVVLDWAVGDYQWREWLGFRIGKVKTPYGFYNEARDADMTRPSILQPNGIYPETQRDFLNAFLGIELYGTLSLGSAGDLKYQAYTGTTDLDDAYAVRRSLETGAASGLNSLPFPLANATYNVSNIDAEMTSLYGGALTWYTPVDGLRFGFSGQSARSEYSNDTTYSGWMGQTPVSLTIATDTVYDQVYNWVLSAEYRRGNLLLAGEFQEARNEITSTIIGLPVPPMPTMVRLNQSYYAQVAYQFTDWLQLSTYYAEFFDNKNDKDGRNFVARGRPAWEAWDKSLAITARFDFTRNWLLKLEAHFHDGSGFINRVENPNGSDKDWTAFFGRFTFYF